MSRRTFSCLLAASWALFLGSVSNLSHATAPTLVGFGPRSQSLAQSDVADASATAAAVTNPAQAAMSGVRFLAAYSHGFVSLDFNSRPVPLRDIAGVDLGVQLGGEIATDWQLGTALALHLPNRSLARIAFEPGAEPLFVRFDPAPHRATADLALALQFKGLSVGAGASVLVDAEGRVDFLLGQDGAGTYADGQANIDLPYHAALIAGAQWRWSQGSLALRYRGAHSIDLALATRADVAVNGNPLNGTTLVSVAGASGYVPASWDMGGMYELGKHLRAMASLQLARWSQAPSPAADLSMQVNLGLTPGQLEARFVRPAYRDTLSPRVGVEVTPWNKDSWAFRAGYQYSPSPVPDQRGMATFVDAPYHMAAAGVGTSLGDVFGLKLRADVAGQGLFLVSRDFDKGSEALPYSRYAASGNVLVAAAGLEGEWQ